MPLLPFGLITGLLLLVLGGKYVRLLAVAVAFAVGVAVAGAFVGTLWPHGGQEVTDIRLVVGLVAGAALAGLTFASKRASRGICAAVAGIVFGMQAYSLGLYHLESWDGMPVVVG